jgi:hypothetical protein
MGQPDNQPRDERPPVDVRLLRTRDLIDLRSEAPGCTVEPTDGAAELVAGPNASLVVHFPPQHLGEQVLQAGALPPPPKPPGPSSHVAAGPLRLVYEVPEGTRITYTLEQVLEASPACACGSRPMQRRPKRRETAASRSRATSRPRSRPRTAWSSPERARRVPPREHPEGSSRCSVVGPF